MTISKRLLKSVKIWWKKEASWFSAGSLVLPQVHDKLLSTIASHAQVPKFMIILDQIIGLKKRWLGSSKTGYEVKSGRNHAVL